MNNKELADALVERGIGSDTGINNIYRIGNSNMLTQKQFVIDWRVAGGLYGTASV